MRLTLRTLLAYLDDTLEPNEIKEIGQKVAESDAAQELVARIKQTTRRRRLTPPPASGPGAKFDANTIAEYLDNELSTELVAELEKTCLESDVHLAEVASCHQILTLVLGEPALVPPTARERMYGLVKGPEAIPFRKARVREGADDGGDRDSDDSLLPGMSSSRGWVMWALPVAAVLVLGALAVAVWQSLPDTRPALRVAANDEKTPPPILPIEPVKDSPPIEPVKDASAPPDTPKDKGPDKPVEKPPVTPDPVVAGPGEGRPQPPSKVRAVVGHYVIPANRGPSILVQRQADQPSWKRLTNGSAVSSADDLVSLPGYNSELNLGPDLGARLVLHGHVREFTVHPFEIMDFLAESAVKLHQPEAGVDLDLTLDRGRIYLSNHRASGPVKVRLRFAGEVWDLTLREPDTEIGVDLFQVYTSDVNYRDGEAPLQQVYLNLLSGRAGVKIDYHEYGNLPAPAVIYWDNKGKGASEPQAIARQAMPSVLAVWSKNPPVGATPQEKEPIALMREALDKLSQVMTEKKAPEGALLEARQAVDSPMTRLLAVYSLSKQSNVAGYRAAFVAGDVALVRGLVEVRKHAGMIVPWPVQQAIIAALGDQHHVVEQKARYAARRALLAPALEHAGFRIEHSGAGLYLWVTRDEDSAASVAALASRGILVGPGSFYGTAGARHVRVALTATDERIAAAASRL